MSMSRRRARLKRRRPAPRSPTKSTLTRSSWSNSPPRTLGTSWRALRLWWPLADRHVRSACSRWTRMAISARGPTATVGRCSTDPALTVDDLGPLSEEGDARLSHPALTVELGQAELQITGRLLQASNATFLAELLVDGAPIECVYKPLEGERPLWDFPLRAVFDVLINDAERKCGHILSSAGQVFGVGHGLSFHTDHKLRTLLWGWAGSELTPRELAAVRKARDESPDQLSTLLSDREISALVHRAELLLGRRRLPRPRGEWPSIPWPPF